ncbi:sigma-54 dependent transcriptional regulator [Mycetohabitans sp. B5]|uniref:DNA-binding NtrC family response regulator n=1 Tax=Mycetohabitans endofungorum TaxID=417203 RepID=A0A2P5K930_9BURK|nr:MULTISPECIES: sigma-54 dependent transcriptional regulator [Mycetohabitans]MCG1054222.1 sigma-54 dependent transcriptional regulator [Mycetohabitans sp. B5]PPB83222.1 DNA-binding NtrC family response regulator [Mycetohabitans endofungorum]QGY72831.1 transcriptional regulatory protein ZraR [Mycetohabitans endofungorum]
MSLSNGSQFTISRRLVYWTRKPSQELQQQLSRRSWLVSVVDDGHAVRHALQHVDQAGGILDLSTVPDTELLDALAVCQAASDVAWIGLVEPRQLSITAVRAVLRDYCFDYVTLPASQQRIADAVGHAYGMLMLRAPQGQSRSREGRMIGTCDAMLKLFDKIPRIARTDAPVLISGESGTGKELTAIAIHERSPRANRPFVAINCGAIPPHLVQSELFGYARGAFTGAVSRKVGRIETANHGTLFLDEIADLPLESQTSLLRFLQERTIQRLGGRDTIHVDVRVISATHANLEEDVNAGRFRADLYHRLCVLRVEQPALRTRGKDIEVLAQCMFERYKSDAPHVKGFSPSAMVAMRRYPWPGNVRELINRVRRALVMTDGTLLTAHDLELEQWVPPEAVPIIKPPVVVNDHLIDQALKRHRGRQTEAARELGISRSTLYRRLRTQRLAEMATDAG